MTRKELEEYIYKTYKVRPDYPWKRDRENGVFRHADNNKWFAIAMKIPQNRLGTDSEKMIEIVNVKAEPVLISGLWNTPGFYPAYHMNKTNWITIALDGTAPGTPLGSFVPTRNPGIRTPGAFQHLARVIFHGIPPESTFRIRCI